MAGPKAPRECAVWGRRTGLILATVGAAVGLGNIWRLS